MPPALARHLPRPRRAGDDRSSQAARRHRDRAAADPRLRRRPASGRARARNYWGYNTLGFFAPEQRYARDRALDEFRSTVSRLHDAGIEIILDVVYNHTAEGNHLGPTLSFRGIDNTSYYWLQPGPAALLRRLHRLRQRAQPHPSARAADGDGFAALLGRGLPRRRLPLRSRHARSAAAPTGFDRGAAFFAAIRQDPVLANVKLIAEPWDIGPGGYQVGGFPPGWSEWNDHFRRTLRRYWRGDGSLHRRARHAHDRLGRPVRPRRPRPALEHQPRHGARRLHARRSRQLRAQAQRGQRRGQSRRLRRQSQHQLRRRRADRRSRDPRSCGGSCGAISSPP